MLLVVSGGYAVWYGRHELRVYSGDLSEDRLVEVGLDLQTRFIVFTESIGAERIAMFVVVVTMLAYATSRFRSSRRAMASAQVSDNADTTTTKEEQHA